MGKRKSFIKNTSIIFVVVLDKKILALAIMLFFAANAAAQSYEITKHTIDIKVDQKGFARVTERFFLVFPNEFNLRVFRQTSEENGVSLLSWKSFDERIHTYIGEQKDIENAQVGFVENEEKYLEINYGLKNAIAHATAETTRRTEFKLKENFFREFLVGALWIIPDNTTIRIELPHQAEIQGTVKPDATIQGNGIAFQGYKSSNVLEVKYRMWKQIASFDLQQAIQEFLGSELMILLAIVVFAMAIMAYTKRKEITQKIENYIVEHSELRGRE